MKHRRNASNSIKDCEKMNSIDPVSSLRTSKKEAMLDGLTGRTSSISSSAGVIKASLNALIGERVAKSSWKWADSFAQKVKTSAEAMIKKWGKSNRNHRNRAASQHWTQRPQTLTILASIWLSYDEFFYNFKRLCLLGGDGIIAHIRWIAVK